LKRACFSSCDGGKAHLFPISKDLENMTSLLRWGGLLGLMMALTPPVLAADYSLTIDRQSVNITGQAAHKITINGSIPGPVLRMTEGEAAVIQVTNRLDTPTSIHWHGLILPGSMDGVDGLNGFSDIPPGGSFTYRFPVRQAGTYWYHSHTGGQEQEGLYGAIIVAPKNGDPIQADRDYTVVISDYTDEAPGTIFSHLKMASDYYNRARPTLGDFWEDVQKSGFRKAWQDATDWGQMRMSRADLADVSGYSFLVNGQTPAQNWTGLFTPGDRVRLRFINASSMSFYDVRIPGLKMMVVEADGQGVEPVEVNEFRFAPGETYDVVVVPSGDTAYSIAAEPIDRSGMAIATLAPRPGLKGLVPEPRPRVRLTMGDMGMMDMDGMDMTMEDMKSGWKQAGTPKGDVALSYRDLRFSGIQPDVREPERTIDVRLGGNMDRYIWTLNGKQMQDADPIRLRYGERVRLTFRNDTMMAHPMHLHGMFVQLENGQPAEKLPNKHTVIVPPGQSYSVLLTADEAGEWSFHCHLLYHMMGGMMTTAVVAKLDAADLPVPFSSTSTPVAKGGHHAH
jgi:FtsP/CotA-like multicopper oxidase with cupredoxin domain